MNIERLKEDARVNEVQAHADPSANNNEDDDSWLDQMVGDFLIENSSFDIFEFVDPGLQSSTVLTSAEEASEERLSQGEECKVRSEVFEDTLLNAECHDQSKNPKCHDQSEDSDCYNISTEFVDTNLLQVNIKTYTCDVCHRQFNRKENLIPHLRTHSGKKKVSAL
ncbi:Zinc finger protein [Pseudolycoriella hygida]|uniref:Zinc finger protein n=1 Tax=Pseudolycoriella hygida TaxID=35572 RepID=A0A9Q0N9A5_9DIPT|nr:Zinc finger protein [Pseudolycoriella hygida]